MTAPSDQPESLVTRAMIDSREVWTPPLSSPPISSADIRKWAIAVYWPETPPRLFWDEGYAKDTRWGGIVAPQEFNPFAWLVDSPPVQNAAGEGRPASGPGSHTMNGGFTSRFGAPMRPGDVITTSSALVDWNERTTRLGLTLFAFRETRWLNQRDELVKQETRTNIRY